jgi:hypothetical protein
VNEQFTEEHCKLAIDACQRLAALPQHAMSAAFWRGMERLWRERLRTADQGNNSNHDEQETGGETRRYTSDV